MQWSPPPTPRVEPAPHVAPLQGAALDRLYKSAVTRQRQRIQEYEAHLWSAVAKVTKVKRRAVVYQQDPEVSRELYYFPVQLKKHHLESAKAALLNQTRSHSSIGPLDSAAQAALGQRLCNESLAHKQAALKELNEKSSLLPELPSQIASHGVGRRANTSLGKLDKLEVEVYARIRKANQCVLGKSAAAAVGERLCSRSMQAKAEAMSELEARYTFNSKCPAKKVSHEDMKKAAERMWKGER